MIGGFGGMGGGMGLGGGARLDRIPDAEGAAYNPQVARRALGYARPYWRQGYLCLALILLAAVMDMLGPVLVKTAIDSYIVKNNLAGLTAISLLTMCVYLTSFLANWANTLIIQQIGQKMLRTMRSQMFRHIQALSLTYFDRVPSGVVVSRLINDVQTMNDLLSTGIVTLFSNVFALLSTLIVMVVLNWRMALAVFAVLPLMPVALWIFTQKAKVAYRNTRVKVAVLTANLAESIAGVRVTQAFAREEESQTRFDEVNNDNRIANINANTLSSGLMPVVEFNNALATVAVIAYGGMLIVHGQATIGVLVAFLAYITRFFQPIRELTQFYNQLQAATAGAEKVFELLDEPITVRETERSVSLPVVRGEVEFQNVSFSYGREPVLDSVSFHADPGQMIAMVGHTGAGKTTVASLLARFYDPVDGAVLLDGYDLRELSFETLRSAVGLVLQDNFLFAGTITDNIRYSRPEASEAEVSRAAQVAGAEDFILQLPLGFQTPVMERAANLSLGQRQLIAIARAVLADPRVLILDEATSNVDSHTEQLVQQALQKLLKGRTSLVIAHRLSTIRAADQVLVLDAGRVVERGRHQELLRRRGAYYRLYRQQFAEPVPA